MKCFEFITALIYTSDRLSSLLTAAEANGCFEPSAKMTDKIKFFRNDVEMTKTGDHNMKLYDCYIGRISIFSHFATLSHNFASRL